MAIVKSRILDIRPDKRFFKSFFEDSDADLDIRPDTGCIKTFGYPTHLYFEGFFFVIFLTNVGAVVLQRYVGHRQLEGPGVLEKRCLHGLLGLIKGQNVHRNFTDYKTKTKNFFFMIFWGQPKIQIHLYSRWVIFR